MKFAKQTFENLICNSSPLILTGREYSYCTFLNCRISCVSDGLLNNRHIIRDVAVNNCTQDRCSVSGAIIEDAVIDNLNSASLLRLHGVALKHVVLRGKISDLLITSRLAPLPRLAQSAMDIHQAANEKYYTSVDWALDISNLACNELDVRWIPAALIRTNPETQAVVSSTRLSHVDWRSIPAAVKFFSVTFQWLEEGYLADSVILAPLLKANWKDYVVAIRELRTAGLAEPA